MSDHPLEGKTVRSVMQLGLFSCPPDMDLRALARMMVERSIHSVVVRGLREGYGIVSDLDLLAGLEDPRARRAADVVRTDVTSVRPDTGFPVGMLSSLDIARAVAA